MFLSFVPLLQRIILLDNVPVERVGILCIVILVDIKKNLDIRDLRKVKEYMN